MTSICRNKWQDEYTNSGTGNHFKQFHDSVRITPTDGRLRFQQTTLFRLKTGHCRLSAHLSRIGICEEAMCNICNTPETVEHFLLHCSKFTDERLCLLQKATEIGVTPNLYNLLTDDRIFVYVTKYVRDTVGRL